MMPARETVAGEALFRFSGSKKAFMAGVIRMRSPFASVSTCAAAEQARLDAQMLQGPLYRILTTVYNNVPLTTCNQACSMMQACIAHGLARHAFHWADVPPRGA